MSQRHPTTASDHGPGLNETHHSLHHLQEHTLLTLGVWLRVVGYEGIYEVDGHCNIKRVAPGPNAHVGQLLTPHRNPDGYLCVRLTKDGVTKTCAVHSLGAEAFFGPLPAGMVVHHLDGCKQNNSIDNLAYVTASENTRHAYETGLAPTRVGEANTAAKLNEAQVLDIRRRYAAGGITQRELGDEFGVDRTTIAHIVRDKSWCHLLDRAA